MTPEELGQCVARLVGAFHAIKREDMTFWTQSEHDRQEALLRRYATLGMEVEKLLDVAGERMLEKFLSLRSISG